MKKSVLSMLAVAALVFGMTSCNGAKKTSEEAEKTEEAAVIAGKAPKDLLTEELKQETIQLLKDLKQLGETIAPLKEKVASIQSARAANAEIMGIRDALLK